MRRIQCMLITLKTDKVMKKVCLIMALFVLSAITAQAQISLFNLDATTNGQTVSYDSTTTVGLLDNGGSGRYSPGDFFISVRSECTPYRFCFQLSELDIDCRDTLYIYDGPDTNSNVIAKINNCTGHYLGQRFFVSPTNNTGILTVRFYAQSGGVGGTGFTLDAQCGTPCEKVVPVIDEVFYRTRNGVVYDSARLRQVPIYDTTWHLANNGDTLGITRIDTDYFVGAHLCIGDGVIFRGHGEYTYEYGYYTPSDATTEFVWDMANDGDTLRGVGLTEITYNDYQKTGCFDIVLTLTDAFGCVSTIYTSVKVRTSLNPIKTIFTLSDICNIDSLPVNMGYDGENATLTLREVESNETVSKTNWIRTFIPDGPSCPPGFYEAPVTFTEFPSGRKVRKGDDICSICINMEHSYMGDLSVSIVCPTGQEAFLFWGNQDTRPRQGQESNGAGAGGGFKYMGYPIENGGLDGSNKCDSLQNPFGGGLDYCFSRNGDYTLVTGVPASSIIGIPAGQHYITSSGYMDNFSVNTPTIPSYFTNSPNTTPSASGTTKRPSDHLAMTDYYTPYADFSELVGCPLNGTWKIRVLDAWGSDNGWVFNWSLDICGVSQDDDCKYTVGLDSLVWRPDPSPQYHDYDLGHYRGLVVNQATPTLSYISSPDTAGFFPINVYIYDEFGCVWDTTTRITTYWTPEPKLGDDTALCGVDHAILDATDRHAATENYSYFWSPTGEGTPTIETSDEFHGDVNYVVSVTNYNENTRVQCVARDTIVVSVRKQPLPNFTPDPFTFEGCDPMTITFHNQSVDAISHKWDFGDGVTSELESPTHTYAEGVYTLKYYAMSDEGCVDSIVSEGGISVFPKPQAGFTWDPVYPSVLNPVVNFVNTTTPHTNNTQYYWQMQYDRDNPLSYETLTTRNATFNYSRYNENVSGNYNVSLIARTRNLAPSGNLVFCADTASNNVLVINDFLQFPNVVTPNGDGINDRFVIQNLVDGLGYPINTLDIYNQWGARVFHRENISSEDDFWDPSDLPDGTYFYRFSARGYNGNIEHNGSVEVLH